MGFDEIMPFHFEHLTDCRYTHTVASTQRSLSVAVRSESRPVTSPGYCYSPRHATHAAGHAWADVWVPDDSWISIDIAHAACFGSDALCQLAVGRDYDSACLVRGVRAGVGEEDMKGALTVSRLEEAGKGARSSRAEGVTA